MQVLKFFVCDAQLHAAHGVRLDEVHKLPANRALRQFALQFAHDLGRHHSLQQPPHGSREPHIDLRQSQFDGAIGAKGGQVDVINTHDFPPAGINDLLIQQILLNRQPRLIRLIELEGSFTDTQLHLPRCYRRNLVVFGH